MRPAKLWIISDTHLNHDAICGFESRPADHGERIRKACAHAMSPNDTLIHLGDVIFYKPETLTPWLASIPGRKVLVRGNHDKSHSDTWFLRAGFDWVCEGLVLKGCLWTHAPVRGHGFPLNIHGHWHGMDGHPEWYETRKYFRVSMEWLQYKPIEFNSIPGAQGYENLLPGLNRVLGAGWPAETLADPIPGDSTADDEVMDRPAV